MSELAAFTSYDRRFAEAMASLPDYAPWTKTDRLKIAGMLLDCLGIRMDWVPTITVRIVGRIVKRSFSVELLQCESWQGVAGAAHLYLPDNRSTPMPFVLLCCGHDPRSKLNPRYQQAARAIVSSGAAVLVPDNIGQGEREQMGHADVVAPFACGTSVQGLIVLETLGWLNWAANDSRFDKTKIAAMGNSGGGTLTMMLGALSDKLCAMSSSGYPSSFEFVARKHKKHCHCNIIPGVVGQIEMWHLLGAFAPKPLLIFQGLNDSLFPPDIFKATAHRTAACYEHAGCKDHFRAEVCPGEHSWDDGRIQLLRDFFCRCLGLESADDTGDALEESALCYDKWPENAIDASTIAARLTRQDPGSTLKLWDVYRPVLPDGMTESLSDETLQILSQFHAFLKEDAL